MKQICLVKIIFLLALFLLAKPTAFAKDLKYPISDIPKELLDDVSVVVRESSVQFVIKSTNESITKYKYVVTILNENGDDESILYIFYDKFSKPQNIKGVRYNLLGMEVNKLKKSDIEDQSVISGGTIDGDGRIKIVDLSSNNYPYTIEYEYELKHENSLFYPTWRPVPKEKSSVQHASFQIESHIENIRFKEVNIENKAKKTSENGLAKYYWELKNYKPLKKEAYGTPFSRLTPKVFTAPIEFSYEAYKGNMNSWKSYGDWITLLNEKRDLLPEATITKIKSLVEGAENKEEKIRRVYNYLQENTRYVSIQLGIGGWQPFLASEVDNTGYGDCKALTNYTKAMLQKVNINSYYTLVRAGKNRTEIHSDFPSQQFNHVFLCVPVSNDTIWLECTSQTTPFGYLGTFTNDRDVLVINEQGGTLVRTPDYLQDDNLQTRTADVKIDLQGNALVDVKTSYSGLQFENDNLNYYLHQSYEEQKKWLYNKLDISGIKIESFKLEQSGDIIPTGKETLMLSVPKYASVNGKRLFLQPNLLNKWSKYPPKVEDRKTKVIIKTAFVDNDVITYTLPDGYAIEYKPEGAHFESKFGEFTTSIEINEKTIVYSRTLKMRKGEFSPEDYVAFRSFIKKIVKSDKSKIVLVKN